MKKQNESLFKIGEITKIMGITRKALLVYEDMGLLTPAVKDPESGYRYYSVDNMTQIRAIRSLQTLGLSLKEIAEYYYNNENIDIYLQRLLDLRVTLEKNIQNLQLRAAKRGDLTVHRTILAHQICFCRQYRCKDVSEAAINLRNTYVDAARTGKISMTDRMFTMRVSSDPAVMDLMCCIPMESSYDGPERVEFPETPALCIYYRGPYEGMSDAVHALKEYMQENNLEPAGPFRSIYIEGPPNRGENSEDYITQVAVPIKTHGFIV